MFFKRHELDIWNVGIVTAKKEEFLSGLPKSSVVWLPQTKSFTFYADPFGLWRNNLLYIFVEAFDYRIGKGTIECFVLDRHFKVQEKFPVIEEQYHLSYPFLIEEEGGIFLIPESSKHYKTWVYKAIDFPDKWQKESIIMPGMPIVDASFLKYKGQWWMFFAIAGKNHRARRELHVATAQSIKGPWKLHKQNPVREGVDSSRPGGKPFIYKGDPYLPVQDCRDGYGKKLHLLRIKNLSETNFDAEIVSSVEPFFCNTFKDGLHHFASCGDVTLIDSKFTDISLHGFLIKQQRKLRRLYSMIKGKLL